jgi:hypothetical protein
MIGSAYTPVRRPTARKSRSPTAAEVERSFGAGGWSRWRNLLGAHHRGQRGGSGQARFERLADAGAVLRRDPAAGQNRLSLREKERVPFSGRLVRIQPLQRRGGRARPIADDDLGPRGQLDAKRLSKDRVDRPERVRKRTARRVDDFFDCEIACIEDDRVCR